MKDSLASLGLSEKDMNGLKHPVVVRERITGDGNKAFRVEFADMANTSSIKRMSAYEEALRDSKRIDPSMLEGLEAKDDEGIDAALARRANQKIAGRYLDSMPNNEAAALLDDKGEMSRHGRERFKAALYLYALPGDAGRTIAKTFVEASDHDLRNFDVAFSRTLPGLAKVRMMFNDGSREGTYDLVPDMAKAIETLDHLKRTDLPLEMYLRQTDMFGPQTTPLQNKMMVKFDELKRSPKKLRELLSCYVETVQDAPDPRQTTMTFVGGGSKKNLESVWTEAIRRYDKLNSPAQGALF